MYDVTTGQTSPLPADVFVFGTYDVLTDRPTPDKKYRDITAYDVLYKVINADVSEFYNNLYSTYVSVSLKTLRESLLTYYGIEFEAFTGVNDNLNVKKVLGDKNISGNMILKNICELNGCFGYITRDNKFRCKTLTATSVKTYDRYIQGNIDYDETIANSITQIVLANDEDTVKVGVAGNKYIINSNQLLSGLKKEILTNIGTAMLPVVSNTAYRPFNVKTYGDPCVEVGDYITIPTSETTVQSFVLTRKLTGTQAMRDVLEAKGEGSNSAQVTGITPIVYDLRNNIGDKVNIIYFTNVVDINIGSSWQVISKMNLSTVDTQIAQFHGVLNVDLDEPDIVYVRYRVNDEYSPFIHISQLPRDTSSITLFLPFEASDERINEVVVEIKTGGADGTIAINNAHFIIQGVNITELDWSGDIELTDNYSLSMISGLSFAYTEGDIDISTVTPQVELTLTDNVTLNIGGGLVLTYNEGSITIEQQVNMHYWTDNNGNGSNNTRVKYKRLNEKKHKKIT